MINPNTYYTVQGWMRSELGLKGNELTVYAIIYGFSQDGNSEFTGSARYLCEWVGCSRATVMTILKKLTDDGLLIKRDIYQNGLQFCAYRTDMQRLTEIRQGVQNLDRGCPNSGQGGVQNLDRGCPEIGHNNTRDIDRKINIEDKDSMQPPAENPPQRPKKETPVKHKYGKFDNVLLTDEELQKLQETFPNDWHSRIEDLSFGIASNGYKYKSHYATILSWHRKEQKQNDPRNGRISAAARRAGGPVGPNGIILDQSKTDLDGMF